MFTNADWFCNLREITSKTQEALTRKCSAKNLFWKPALVVIKKILWRNYEIFQSRLFIWHFWTTTSSEMSNDIND